MQVPRSAMRRLSLWLSLALLLSLLAVSPATALEVAVQDDSVFVTQRYGDRDKALRQARELRVSWLRINVTSIDSAALVRYAKAISAASKYGIRTQIAIAPGNGYANPMLNDPAAFSRFASVVARSFKGWVRRYSIWNEPNCCQMPVSRVVTRARRYREIYKAGYRAVKSIDPGAQVLFGELVTVPNVPLFLRESLCLDSSARLRRGCTALRSAGLAYHPYQSSSPPEYRQAGQLGIGNIDDLKNLLWIVRRGLNRGNDQPVPIYFTEFGYRTSLFDLSTRPKLPDARIADWLPRAFTHACKARGSPVRQLLIFHLYPSRKQWDTSILGLFGEVRPPYEAMRRWVQRNPSCVS
jgi:hypothetical protein